MANSSGSKHTSHKTPKTESATMSSGGAPNTAGTEHTKKKDPTPPTHEHPTGPGNKFPPNGEHRATNR